MAFDFILLGTLAVITILVISGLVFTINVLIWKVNHLQSENDSLVKDVNFARAQVDSLREKLREARCVQRKATIGDN